ncbi:hypothetical protein NC651_009986 [Populus alba x Populus x berolinensis]|nr:hypothetical protein NC651_009986 [Populus alba x Populus x berolinensis]
MLSITTAYPLPDLKDARQWMMATDNMRVETVCYSVSLCQEITFPYPLPDLKMQAWLIDWCPEAQYKSLQSQAHNRFREIPWQIKTLNNL